MLQNEDIDATEGFLQLAGLQDYGESDQSEHLYAEVAEVTETVPNYTIPVTMTNVNCPDVKISVL